MEQQIEYFTDQRLCFIQARVRSFLENTDDSYSPQEQNPNIFIYTGLFMKYYCKHTQNSYK